MKMERCEMPSFAVIGKEGSTKDGQGFIARLWEDANAHFAEVAAGIQKEYEMAVASAFCLLSAEVSISDTVVFFLAAIFISFRV